MKMVRMSPLYSKNNIVRVVARAPTEMHLPGEGISEISQRDAFEQAFGCKVIRSRRLGTSTTPPSERRSQQAPLLDVRHEPTVNQIALLWRVVSRPGTRRLRHSILSDEPSNPRYAGKLALIISSRILSIRFHFQIIIMMHPV